MGRAAAGPGNTDGLSFVGNVNRSWVVDIFCYTTLYLGKLHKNETLSHAN